ncbi:PhzF family phenazine biosynthesis protein [Cyclobacterium plantarum]|uniref:PhzF family phenazine biosynthesis protein n=1 Tax=Cyclobacterium plantarum TaxID=2716263 RepID=A0ABX0HE71_9BACT|nr:PhzF family phenazine biosynthesis protein [Cyclobacterium plantarum]NHE59620.1 PhzF family phenazine biosynthesis protein [Cyclobacterium plantarum]
MKPTVIAVFTAPELGFRGNPAAVVRSPTALNEKEMQEQASGIGMPATSFLFQDIQGKYHVRWFAPDEEIGLCGHGAAAAGIFLALKNATGEVELHFQGGVIVVKVAGDRFSLHLEAIPVLERINPPQAILDGLGIPVLEMYKTANKHLIITDTEAAVAQMRPDFVRLRQSDIFGYAISAKGDQVDFVSRTLVPHVQQLEDHATGSSHALLVPYWSEKLNKKNMTAHQLSPRGGRFFVEMAEEEVILTGTYEIEK